MKATAALVAIMLEVETQTVRDAAQAADLDDGFTGQRSYVCMAQALAAAGVELPALMQAGGRASRCRRGIPSARLRAGERWPGITREGGR